MIVGGYTLNMYCDNPDCPHDGDSYWWPKEFIGDRGGKCRAEARVAGWKMDREYTLCPACNKASRQHEQSPKK